MTATIVAQQAINGIVLGSLYVLVALGLTLIYGVLVQINFAHADFVTLGAFSAYFFMHVLGGSYLLSIGVALVVGGILGWLINVAIFAPLRRKGNELLPLIATIGVSVMMQNAMLSLFGPVPYAFETPYSQQVFRVAGTFFTMQSVIIIAVSTATIGNSPVSLLSRDTPPRARKPRANMSSGRGSIRERIPISDTRVRSLR